MKTLKANWKALLALALLCGSIPLPLAAADPCLGLPPDLERACLRLYVDELQAQGYEINNSISGTWYDPTRSGEGFMIDVANHGVVVVTYNTYDKLGNQLWLFGDGNVDSSVMEVEFYLTDGGLYGDGFDPQDVNRYFWGIGTFTFTGCSEGAVDIFPTPEFEQQFEAIHRDIVRLTVPVNCTPRD